ncbi:HalOD1 output domain-containing protein [Haloferax volcanii]|uniref:HalOD1 output domain-containing protein n=1 Tax=Haloferax volcanii TaxID=2246 RepID=UPI0023DA2F40|nr:HalOD1 output domain-containing protein [Haloferax lucentense]WEL27445.1 hypothetical protein SVXHx_3237 [Haloferax lucentense]
MDSLTQVTKVASANVYRIDDADSIVTILIRIIGNIEKTDTTNLPPLYDSVKSETFDKLEDFGRNGIDRLVEFRYIDYEIILIPEDIILVFK